MKLQEIKDKTIEELKNAILSAKQELFQLKIKHNKMTPLENPAQIKTLKKQVAQMKTVLREKELNA
ncbi:TPA: 50S ribosomal protein L29 [Candidatus Galligastranaerophilus intestinigallinarum]|nr:50S ribosomal protein L29 [Candidatus Galligastranaerophilus intestinigallinarum]